MHNVSKIKKLIHFSKQLFINVKCNRYFIVTTNGVQCIIKIDTLLLQEDNFLFWIHFVLNKKDLMYRSDKMDTF